mmetsp:Transcript_7065/g.12061  ORF Transcript_7065/g.12061 Transcript_7065/m.12061 type:complete len:243 (-) Transcript_7065:1439-2167(-)
MRMAQPPASRTPAHTVHAPCPWAASQMDRSAAPTTAGASMLMVCARRCPPRPSVATWRSRRCPVQSGTTSCGCGLATAPPRRSRPSLPLLLGSKCMLRSAWRCRLSMVCWLRTCWIWRMPPSHTPPPLHVAGPSPTTSSSKRVRCCLETGTLTPSACPSNPHASRCQTSAWLSRVKSCEVCVLRSARSTCTSCMCACRPRRATRGCSTACPWTSWAGSATCPSFKWFGSRWQLKCWARTSSW